MLTSLPPEKAACKCCSFGCMYNWNKKYSPLYLRSRRHLQIDLLQRRGQSGGEK
jgi:hypothetical protein